MGIQGLSTTFDDTINASFFTAITQARPDDSGALWFRDPKSLEGKLESKKTYLIAKIKEAFNDEENTRVLIKEVFVEILLVLET